MSGSTGHRGAGLFAEVLIVLLASSLVPSVVQADPPSVALLSPRGGERWTGGTTHTIQWTMSSPGPVPLLVWIEYVLDPSPTATWLPVLGAQGISRASGLNAFPWMVPCPDAVALVRVKARDANGLAASDLSETTFHIDCTPPIADPVPGDGASGVGAGGLLRVVFNEPMDTDALPVAADVLLSPPSGAVPSWGPRGDELRVPADGLARGRAYAWGLSCDLRDDSDPGNPTAGCGTTLWTFTTAVDEPPSVTILFPVSGQRLSGDVEHSISWRLGDESPTSQLRAQVNFSSPTMAAAISPGSLYGLETFEWRTPGVDIEDASIRVDVVDAAGNTMSAEGGPFSIDATPPGMRATIPPDGATGVDPSEDLRISFTERMNRTATEAAFRISPDPGAISFLWTVDGEGDVLRVRHGPLVLEADYTITFLAGIRDDSIPGNAPSSTLIARFRARPGILVPVVTVAGVAVVAGAVLGGTEIGRLAMISLFVAPAYGRKVKGKENKETRGMIRGYLRVHPGDTYTEIKRNLGLNNGTLDWHLMKLQKEGVVLSRATGTRRRYFLADSPAPKSASIHDAQQRILAAVSASPGMPVRLLAEHVGMSSQLVLYHLRELSRGDLVVLERRGFRLCARPFADRPSKAVSVGTRPSDRR